MPEHTKLVPLTLILTLALFLEWVSGIFNRPFHFFKCVCIPKWNLFRQRWSVSRDGQIGFFTLSLMDKATVFILDLQIYMFYLWNISLSMALARFHTAATSGASRKKEMSPFPCSAYSVYTHSCPDTPDLSCETLNKIFHDAGLLLVILKQNSLKPTTF